MLRELFAKRLSERGLSSPYGRAARLQVAYLTDLFNDLITEEARIGISVDGVMIDDPQSWREIDTVQDLERAQAVISW